MTETIDASAIVVIHPTCLSALDHVTILVLPNGGVAIEGLCLTCERYVHLRTRRSESERVTALPQSSAIAIALDIHGGNVTRAAQWLGVARATLQRYRATSS